ncbi:MAG: competence protein TfoX [Hyphomicrobiales bacterium]|nr:MAG: competence protein TfoX [Hyphomicrobiales bacterium]
MVIVRYIPAMNTPIESMRNLGPATARMLAEVDIPDAETLKETGAVVAYTRLKFRFGSGASLNALYAMEAALRGCDWRDLDAATKQSLKAKVTAK